MDADAGTPYADWLAHHRRLCSLLGLNPDQESHDGARVAASDEIERLRAEVAALLTAGNALCAAAAIAERDGLRPGWTRLMVAAKISLGETITAWHDAVDAARKEAT